MTTEPFKRQIKATGAWSYRYEGSEFKRINATRGLNQRQLIHLSGIGGRGDECEDQSKGHEFDSRCFTHINKQVDQSCSEVSGYT